MTLHTLFCDCGSALGNLKFFEFATGSQRALRQAGRGLDPNLGLFLLVLCSQADRRKLFILLLVAQDQRVVKSLRQKGQVVRRFLFVTLKLETWPDLHVQVEAKRAAGPRPRHVPATFDCL